MPLAPQSGGFSIEGNSTGVLLVHGLAGAPQNLWPIAEALWRRGYAVEAPRLPGHGSEVGNLAVVDSAVLIAHLEDSLSSLQERCTEVFVMGVSLGGALAAHLAVEHPEVAGLVAMAAPLFPISELYATVSSADAPEFVAAHPRAALLDRAQGVICYDEFPASVLAEALRFSCTVGERLPRLKAPALFMCGAHDPLVKPSQGENAVSLSSNSSLMILNHSSHMLALDYERELVVGSAVNFVDINRSNHGR